MATLTTYALSASAILLATVILIYRRLRTILDPSRSKPAQVPGGESRPAHLMVVLGSGGHTAEMLGMLERAFVVGSTDAVGVEREDGVGGGEARLEWGRFGRRTWVVGEGDALSASRARGFEDGAAGAVGGAAFTIRTVPRARRIHQTLLTTPLSCLQTLISALKILTTPPSGPRHSTPSDLPDIILTNGPATAAIMILAALILRFFDIRRAHSRGKLRTVYVESWARVRRLSLTGRLVQGVVDRFVVQWPQLVDERRETGREYGGWLV